MKRGRFGSQVFLDWVIVWLSSMEVEESRLACGGCMVRSSMPSIHPPRRGGCMIPLCIDGQMAKDPLSQPAVAVGPFSQLKAV